MVSRKRKDSDVREDVEKQEKKLAREKKKLLKKLRFINSMQKQSQLSLDQKKQVIKKRRRSVKKKIPESLSNFGDIAKELEVIQNIPHKKEKKGIHKIIDREKVSKRSLKYVQAREHKRVQQILVDPIYKQDPLSTIVQHIKGKVQQNVQG